MSAIIPDGLPTDQVIDQVRTGIFPVQFGQLGDNAVPTIATISSRATLQQVFLNGTALGPVTDINAFGNRSLALVADGSANGVWYGWGDNGFGQLGNPVPNNSSAFFSTPTKVLGY